MSKTKYFLVEAKEFISKEKWADAINKLDIAIMLDCKFYFTNIKKIAFMV